MPIYLQITRTWRSRVVGNVWFIDNLVQVTQKSTSPPPLCHAAVFPYLETHGKVLPWNPPQFGLPKPVLVKLRDELREKLIEKALAATKPLEVPEARPKERPKDIIWMQDQLPDPFQW